MCLLRFEQGRPEACIPPVDNWHDVQYIPFESMVIEKWLNVILDLDGLLCTSKDVTYFVEEHCLKSLGTRSLKLKQMTLDFKDVIVRPGIRDFLWDLSDIANISI